MFWLHEDYPKTGARSSSRKNDEQLLLAIVNVKCLGVKPKASRGLVGYSHATVGLIASGGLMGHGRGVHGPRCPPSHLPNLGEAVESGHIPILMLFDAFHGDVYACTSVAVVLM